MIKKAKTYFRKLRNKTGKKQIREIFLFWGHDLSGLSGEGMLSLVGELGITPAFCYGMLTSEVRSAIWNLAKDLDADWRSALAAQITMREVRAGLLFFGCDTSHLIDEEILDAMAGVADTMFGFGITASEAADAICQLSVEASE